MTKKIVKSLHISTFLGVLCVLVLGCQSGDQTSAPTTRPTGVTIQIVHGPELRSLLSSMREQFLAANPRLADGTSLQIELISEFGLSAARRIANGELKVHGWLAQSSSFVSYTNSKISNLGATQGSCKPLFSTPIVLAGRTQDSAALGTTTTHFSPSLAFDNHGSSPDSNALSISLLHANPRSSITGFSALVQLALFASDTAPLTQEILKKTATLNKVKNLESLVSRMSPSEGFLLKNLSISKDTKARFVITTEQQFSLFTMDNIAQRANKKAGADGGLPPLIAYYPEDHGLVLDHQLCFSQADWSSAAHTRGLQMFADFLASEPAQKTAQSLGFRPTLALAPADPLLPRYGIDPEYQPSKLEAPTGGAIDTLVQEWPNIKRPTATALIVDGSGSMEGGPLSEVKEQYRKYLAAGSPGDLNGLISFNSSPLVISPLVEGAHGIIPLLDSIKAQGGSAIYDAVKSGFELLNSKEAARYRKTLILVTDGEDKNSDVPLQSLLSFIGERAARDDISVYVIAINHGRASYSDLIDISRTANGEFHEATVGDLNGIFNELLSNQS